ncbi:ABC transporter ATP-binding protein [Corynebacterium freiburgense]|uniref:ABC transporter ATP-binding protein n=1 Tax=Corynebacterium freiburgense TaxID=556548 RepID=UPI000401F306|nr:ATP-binding cassette domain-containing protein [Corynebacterium freiburgense]WJZ03818.1 Glycine betaine/carnitine/choline transport ATP-binding protein OpuCA [Corynebacterium freiburgense]
MIIFDQVSKNFDAKIPAVDGFSYHFRQGRTTCLVGSSGSGKTTLLRMINRMVEPSAGRITVRGEDISGVDPVKLRRSIGYVMQSAGLLPHRTVAQNIGTVARLNKLPDIQSRVEKLMQMLDLSPDLAPRYPAELSGGQAQRVGVARALASDPDILLMDEPFGAVDPVVRRELQNMVLRLQRRLNKTIILVTHDIDEAFRLGDDIVLLSQKAHIEQAGSAADFVTHPANDFVASFVGVEDRAVHVEEREGQRVVVDRHGRVNGVVT